MELSALIFTPQWPIVHKWAKNTHQHFTTYTPVWRSVQQQHGPLYFWPPVSMATSQRWQPPTNTRLPPDVCNTSSTCQARVLCRQNRVLLDVLRPESLSNTDLQTPSLLSFKMTFYINTLITNTTVSFYHFVSRLFFSHIFFFTHVHSAIICFSLKYVSD